MAVEQAQLLATVHGVEGVVDVEHDAARHLAKALAILVHHDAAHAQQGVPVRQVLGPRHRGLRAQVAMLRQPIHRQLEQRVSPQAVGVVAVLVTGGDHQHAEADDLIEPVHDALGRPRVTDARGKTPGDPQSLLDLPQHQQTPVRGHQCAVEPRFNFPPADWRKAGQDGGSLVTGGHAASGSVRIGFDLQILLEISRLYKCPPTLMHFGG